MRNKGTNPLHRALPATKQPADNTQHHAGARLCQKQRSHYTNQAFPRAQLTPRPHQPQLPSPNKPTSRDQKRKGNRVRRTPRLLVIYKNIGWKNHRLIFNAGSARLIFNAGSAIFRMEMLLTIRKYIQEYKIQANYHMRGF
jgi:hypothetical protein